MNLKSKAKQIISDKNLAGSFAIGSIFVSGYSLPGSIFLIGSAIAVWHGKIK
jgi:hypothetical protein